MRERLNLVLRMQSPVVLRDRIISTLVYWSRFVRNTTVVQEPITIETTLLDLIVTPSKLPFPHSHYDEFTLR